MKAVAGFAGFAVADAVGENQVIASGVEELAFAEQFVRQIRADEIAAVTGCAVQNQDGIANDSFLIAARCSECAVMDSQFGQDFAGSKMKIADEVVGLCRCGIIRSRQGLGKGNQQRPGCVMNDPTSVVHWQQYYLLSAAFSFSRLATISVVPKSPTLRTNFISSPASLPLYSILMSWSWTFKGFDEGDFVAFDFALDEVDGRFCSIEFAEGFAGQFFAVGFQFVHVLQMANLSVEFGFPFAGDVGSVHGTESEDRGE